VFALRFRGVDPERFFNAIYPYTGWFFRWYTVLFVMMFAFSALMLVMSQYDTFAARLPTFHQFFGAKNWIYIALTMAIVKVFHEFGHGLSCKHFGGECHELGAMLLVFTPALYCNVSDSWMLPNKYHRAAIGAAGMYVEIFIASIATYVWWFSQPGLLINQVALATIFICSVSTVMFNGNPLLRFDGYYILMDLLEIPNLRQKSTEVLRRFLTELCLGIEQPESPFLPQRNRFLFGLFTVAAEIYRLMVVFSILFFLNKVFEPYGLKIIGQLIGLSGVVGLVIQPLYQLYQFFYMPGRMNKVKKHRVYVTLTVVALVFAGICFIPLPFSVNCAFEINSRDSANVFAPVAGILAEKPRVKPGDMVKKGDVIAVLTNPQLEAELVARKGAMEKAKIALQNIEMLGLMPTKDQNLTQQSILAQLPAAQEVYHSAERMYLELKDEVDKLVVTAPRDGVVIAPPHRPVPPNRPEGRLPTWSGSPFDPYNVGARLERTDLICRIGDPKQKEAMLVIDQTDIDLVEKDQDARFLTEAYVDRVMSGKIVDIGKLDLQHVPAGLSTQAQGDLNTKMDKSGQVKTISTTYQARILVDDAENLLFIGQRGQARVYPGWQSLGTRLWRYIIRTFHFHL
jgi:putative peptide zinc metalloprotease protein